jgi:glutathione S-transferase
VGKTTAGRSSPEVNVTQMLRVYRIPFSTNVERVSLALAHKGLEVDWEDVDPRDRSPVQRVSGQPLVPVLVDDGRVIVDSTVILRYLEELQPEPALFPRDDARRAELDVFLDWFNRVWKRPPNEIEAERGKPEPDERRIDELGRELTGSLDLFERMLAERDYLFGEFSAADCAAFPFLKYGLVYDETDTEEFHLILREYLASDGRFPRLEAWIRRVDAHRRA